MCLTFDADLCNSDLHAPQTAANLAALLVVPINSYQSVLTLLAIPRYVPLLIQQLFSTCPSILHSIISSVLIKDQTDASAVGGGPIKDVKEIRRQGPYVEEKEDTTEEQGWARMVVLSELASIATPKFLWLDPKLRTP